MYPPYFRLFMYPSQNVSELVFEYYSVCQFSGKQPMVESYLIIRSPKARFPLNFYCFWKLHIAWYYRVSMTLWKPHTNLARIKNDKKQHIVFQTLWKLWYTRFWNQSAVLRGYHNQKHLLFKMFSEGDCNFSHSKILSYTLIIFFTCLGFL